MLLDQGSQVESPGLETVGDVVGMAGTQEEILAPGAVVEALLAQVE